MVASKKLHCVICNKKCSGNVLRYQDQYYHKQCFELEQSQGTRRQESYVDSKVSTGASSRQAYHATDHSHSSQSPILSSSNYNANQHSETMNHSTGQTTAASQQQHQASRGVQSSRLEPMRGINNGNTMTTDGHLRSQTIDSRFRPASATGGGANNRSATLPHSLSSPNGFVNSASQQFTSEYCLHLTLYPNLLKTLYI